MISARQASRCCTQEVLLNTYHFSLWDAQPLLQCSTQTYTHRHLLPLSSTYELHTPALPDRVLPQPPLMNRSPLGKKYILHSSQQEVDRSCSKIHQHVQQISFLKSSLETEILPLISRQQTTAVYCASLLMGADTRGDAGLKRAFIFFQQYGGIDKQVCWHHWLWKLRSAIAGNRCRRGSLVQQVGDMFGDAFLTARHCQGKQLLYVVTIPCVFRSSLGSIINIIFLFLQSAFSSLP